MKIRFVCHYPSVKGKNIFLSFENDFFDSNDTLIPLSYSGNNRWEIDISAESILHPYAEYKYCVMDDETGEKVYEHKVRTVKINHKRFSFFVIKDHFADDEYEQRLWNSSIFTDILFNREGQKTERFRFPSAGKHILEFRVSYVPLARTHTIGLTGNIPELGMWDAGKVLILNDYNYPEWKLALNIKHRQRIEYKYVVVNKHTGKVINWETGDNHILDIDDSPETFHCVINDDKVSFEDYVFRGAGVSIPVFSLRSRNSFGIGDFTDLKLMIDWAVRTRLKIIQILPVNDTTAHYNFLDSYPYNTISVFALNPN